MIKLKKLLKEIEGVTVRGAKDIEVTGICNDSRLIAPGNLFVAKKGLRHDGAKLIADAIAAGATAVLTDLYDPFFPHVVQLIASDVPMVEAMIARRFYHCSDQQLYLIGITGTNGKTTTSYLIKHLFDGLGSPCGLIGSIARIVGKQTFPAPQNTPDVITCNKLFHEMLLNGCESCVMEVTSHGLHQGRVRMIEFDVAVFTNLTQDHLDYHQTMESYADAKASFFRTLDQAGLAIVNGDDPWHQTMIAGCQAPVFTFGIDAPCDLKAENLVLDAKGAQFDLNYRGSRVRMQSPLIGRFNVYNCLSAMSVGLAKGYDLHAIAGVLSSFGHVPGRLERIPNGRGLNIYVDYAHTDDALKNVLHTLREMTPGKIITVFGCGGNRDPLKRPKMGAVAEALSDITIITTDNPRNEDPGEIIRQVLSGLIHPSLAWVSMDREEAIARAIQAATPLDSVLIAGKGHEAYQIFSHETIAFDDRLVAQRFCHEHAET